MAKLTHKLGKIQDNLNTASAAQLGTYLRHRDNQEIHTGGRNTQKWKWGNDELTDKQAELAYQAIRDSKTDVTAIARYLKLDPKRIQKIKEYLFNNPEWTGADPEIAAAWHRMRTGKEKPMDRLLLKHETAEMWLRRAKDMPYWEAHRQANLKYNWQQIIEEGEK